MKFRSGKQFEQPAGGTVLARCYGLVALGTQRHVFQDEVKLSNDVRILFELPLNKMTGKFDPEATGKIFMLAMTCKASLHAKAKLRKMVRSWRGKDFKDKAECDAFDPKKLIGQPCRLTLVEDGEHTNIDSIAPLDAEDKKRMPKQVNKSVFFSLDPDEFDAEVYASLGKATQEKIAKSPEYAALTNGGEAGAEPHGEPSDEPPQNDDESF